MPEGRLPNVYFHITVRVNSLAEPLSEITNTATVESFGENESYHWNTQTTPICCWGGEIIYVNADAPASSAQTGTRWEDAIA